MVLLFLFHIPVNIRRKTFSFLRNLESLLACFTLSPLLLTIFKRVVVAFLRRTKEYYCSFWNKNFVFSNAERRIWKEKEKNSVASS